MKSKITKKQPKQTQQYDLEDRTLKFAKEIRDFTKKIKSTLANREYIKQIVRSSASIGANYIEANESLSKKDFIMRIKISRKEAKETRFWLQLLDLDNNKVLQSEDKKLLKEATELMKIFGSILQKTK